MDTIEQIIEQVKNIVENPPDWWNKQLDIWNSTPIDILFEDKDGLQ